MTFGIVLGVLAGLLAVVPGKADDGDGVPQARLALLQTGANVTLWFRGGLANTDDHFENYISDAEMDAMRRIGLKHVRLWRGIARFNP